LLVTAAMASTVALGACAGGGTQQASRPNPAQAIISAVQHTEEVTSLTVAISDLSSGASEATTAISQEQVKPTLLLSMRLDMPTGDGAHVVTTVVVTPTTYYVTIPHEMAGHGKYWGKIAVRPYGGLTSMAQVFQGQTDDPLAQIMLLRVVNGVHNVGTQVIGGARTTHYSCYYAPSKAIAALPPILRSQLTPVPEALRNRVNVNIWIDSAQQIRKLSEVESVDGVAVTTTIVFSGFNRHVHITIPPASQVTSLPLSG
jgi:hypothetical protein